MHEDKDKLKAALALLFLFPGSPSIFYGTECYTVGGYDPDCRRCMDWERTPEKDLSELIGKLSNIRKECEFSFEGTAIYPSEDNKLLCMKRHGKNGDVALYINESGSPGRDEDILVEAGRMRLFANGGEVL